MNKLILIYAYPIKEKNIAIISFVGSNVWVTMLDLNKKKKGS